MTGDQLQRLRHRAHVHTDRCCGRYEACGEHHLHDDMCGARPLICGLREDPDLIALLAAFDSLMEQQTR